METNYKPKFYNCILDGVKTEGSKHVFYLTENSTNMRKQIYIEIDQPTDLILERMKECVAGNRRELYLTRGMRDIDVFYLGDNRWQLFDEFDIFEFKMVV